MVGLEQLTEDQLDAVQVSTQQHRVVIGGPGSGKSLVLIHRAQRLIAKGCSTDAVKLVVFTKVLRSYLQQAASQVGLPDDFVMNFDRWCRSVYLVHVSSKPPKLKSPDDWNAMRGAVLAVLKEKSIEPVFDAVLVDEGQDLTNDMLEILRLCSRHVTVALDVRQDLFNTDVNVARACELLDVARPSVNLLTAYRCTPLIVGLAAEFLPNDAERLNFKSANLLPIDGVERPVAYQWTTETEEFNELALRLMERAFEGHSTAVVLPTNELVKKYEAALRARDLDVLVVNGDEGAEEPFHSLRPMLLTYHSVKGLTVDSIFLPGLSEANFGMTFLSGSERKRRLLFVGITRASKWVWMGIPENSALAEVADLVQRAEVASLGGVVFRRPTGPLPNLSAASVLQVPTKLGPTSPTVGLKKPAVKSAAKPVVKSAAKPVVKSAAKPVVKSAAKPASKPARIPDQRLTDLL